MRILVADDSELVRRGVVGILLSEVGWEVCGEAKDGTEAIQKAGELIPDVILLDISMPGLNGLDVARLLRDAVPGAKILLMSQYDPVQVLPRALDVGAKGCIDKGRLRADLLPAIKRATANGEISLIAKSSEGKGQPSSRDYIGPCQAE
jgi:DNA-binding NarL/FixJ family response regulator